MLNRKLMMGNMPCDRRCQVVPGASCNSVGWRAMHGNAVRRLEGVGWDLRRSPDSYMVWQDRLLISQKRNWKDCMEKQDEVVFIQLWCIFFSSLAYLIVIGFRSISLILYFRELFLQLLKSPQPPFHLKKLWKLLKNSLLIHRIWYTSFQEGLVRFW